MFHRHPRVKNSVTVAVALALSSLTALAGPPASGLPDDPVLRSMKDELSRTMAQLQLGKMDRPFYVEYGVADTTGVEVEASFGALVRVQHERSRPFRAEVRIGSYDMDNSRFIGSRDFFGFFGRPTGLVTDDSYEALRQDLWLATDQAYKRAIEQFARKEAHVRNKLQSEKIPDFSREEAVAAVGDRASDIGDTARYEELAVRLSAIFREFPAVAGSSVHLRLRAVSHYFVNSEGGLSRQPGTLASIVAHATTQAPDGMVLKHYVVFHAPALDRLPPEDEMAAAIRRMAGELTALRDAPVLEQYIGPVLATGQASSEMIALGLAPHLSGERPLLYEDERMASSAFKSDLADRLNRRVLPAFLSVRDDPTRKDFGGRPLIGAYTIDDQGMKARPTSLVERGVLKGLLMSRRPRKEITQSNGHARSTDGDSPQAMTGNLLVEAAGGRSYEELKRQLVDLCRSQELPYGLILRVLDSPAITGGEEGFSFSGRAGRSPLAPPVLAYRVFATDGSEELVRGLQFGEFTTRAFKDIIAAGDDPYVLNRLGSAGTSGGFGFSFFGFGGSDRALSGIPTSIVAPSLLFEELEFQRATTPHQKPPLLAHPFFEKP